VDPTSIYLEVVDKTCRVRVWFSQPKNKWLFGGDWFWLQYTSFAENFFVF